MRPLRLLFWRSESGNEPVRDWLRSLPAEVTKTMGDDIRYVFTIENGTMLLLHGFLKKTKKTPPQDIALARRRQKG